MRKHASRRQSRQASPERSHRCLPEEAWQAVSMSHCAWETEEFSFGYLQKGGSLTKKVHQRLRDPDAQQKHQEEQEQRRSDRRQGITIGGFLALLRNVTHDHRQYRQRHTDKDD